MSSLRTIMICQNEICQARGSKKILQYTQKKWSESFSRTYPDVLIKEWNCSGDCEMGPIVQVNDSIILREVQESTIDQLLSDPQRVLGGVLHVLEQDRDAFERIIHGDLF